jgi:hypothetical protein
MVVNRDKIPEHLLKFFEPVKEVQGGARFNTHPT